MGKKLTRDLLLFIPTAALIALISFSLMYFAPGRPAFTILLGKNPLGGVSEESVAALEAQLGLDLSFWGQFGLWAKGAVHGDFGNSFVTGLPVSEEFFSRIGCTLLLSGLGIVFALIIGLLAGGLCAYFRGTLLDRALSAFSAINMSLPSFWVALLLLWFFAIRLRWFPAFGFTGLRDLILPGIALGLPAAGSIFKLTRVCVIEALESAWMYTLKGKGLSESAIITRHTLKNVAIPVLTQTVNGFIMLLGGSMIVESIFGLPGVGFYLVHAVVSKDIPVVSGFVFGLGIIIILINLLLELTYGIIDPRTRSAVNEK